MVSELFDEANTHTMHVDADAITTKNMTTHNDSFLENVHTHNNSTGFQRLLRHNWKVSAHHFLYYSHSNVEPC